MVFVVVVVVIGFDERVDVPPETARALPTIPSTHASFEVVGSVPIVDARLLTFGPAAPSGV